MKTMNLQKRSTKYSPSPNVDHESNEGFRADHCLANDLPPCDHALRREGLELDVPAVHGGFVETCRGEDLDWAHPCGVKP